MEGDPRAADDSGKRRRCEQPPPLNLLGALPDSLLLHILSFLRMKDVITTALLSRRWRHLWTSTPCLHFCYRPTERSFGCDYYHPDFIDWALILHEGTEIRTFRAAVDLSDQEDSDQSHAEISKRADSWVRFALRRRVQVFELNWEIGYKEYKLPVCVFSCESLVSLRLKYCHLEPPSRISMSSLRILTLCRVTMDGDDSLKGLLAGCPSLEYLTLKNFAHSVSSGGIRVEGSNSRLRALKICHNGYHVGALDNGILVSAPSIKELVLIGCVRRACYAKNGFTSIAKKGFTSIAKKDFTSIVTASLDLKPARGALYDARRVLVRLLRDLRHVKALKLSSGCVQALSVEVYKREEVYKRDIDITRLEFTEINIISLELTVGFVTSEFRGIFIALRSFTKLEFLTIDITGESERITSRNDASESAGKETAYIMSNEWPSATMFQHLKTVTIFGLVRNLQGGRK